MNALYRRSTAGALVDVIPATLFKCHGSEPYGAHIGESVSHPRMTSDQRKYDADSTPLSRSLKANYIGSFADHVDSCKQID